MSLIFQSFAPDQKLPTDWDDFVLANSTGSVHQIRDWKNLQNKIPGRGHVWAFEVRNSGKLVATSLCVRMSVGLGGKFWYYSARGPVFEPKTQNKAAQLLLTEGQKILQKEGALFWRIDPYLSDFSDFKNIKFKPATQQYQPTDTLEIDCTQTDDKILALMKRKGRYNIKIARKKGVTIESILASKSTPKDLDDFWGLTQTTTERDAFSGHEKNYYAHFLQSLPNQAVLFFALIEGRRVATALSTFCGNKAIYYFGASTSDREDRKYMAPYLLQWSMIQHARSKGCTSYDFLGIAPENEPNHAYTGISDFKWKFGGTRKTYAPGQEIIFQKGWYTLYRIAKKLRP